MPRKIKLVTISNVTEFGNTLARSLRANLKWSKQLRGQVRLKKAIERGDSVSIEVTIAEGNADLAGMARAFAFGSGIHATRGGKRGKYKIPGINNPNPPPFLQFKGTNKFAGQIIRVKQVKHPGVKSKDYINKSIQTTMKRATPELKAKIRKNLVDGLRLSIRGTK